jgi:hypothetical protein
MHISIVKSQWLRGANGITQATPTYLKDYFGGIFFGITSQKSLKIWNSLILLCQGLCERFQKKFNFKFFETH